MLKRLTARTTVLFSLYFTLLLPSYAAYSETLTNEKINTQVNHYLQSFANPETGIGAREAGTAKEQQTIDYIEAKFKKMGLSVNVQSFTFAKNKLTSANVIADLNKSHKKTLILAAHLDSTAAKLGSDGAIDNATGLAAMLAVAENLAALKTLPYNLRFIAFGAEEVGKLGSKHYVKNLIKENGSLNNIVAMINLDTVAGGDFLYVHSAHTTPYKCRGITGSYNSDTHVRDALFGLSKKLLNEKQQYLIHPEYKGYPKGVTGSWSDHAPFACAGVPIAYIESTNFTLNGKDGYDGYSQTDHADLWDCFDSDSACERKKEKQWGHIWHTKSDKLAQLNQLFPHRITDQLNANVRVLMRFLRTFNLEENSQSMLNK
ncbi:MAG: M28 family metallopeptidase [Thalassotalea sp.]